MLTATVILLACVTLQEQAAEFRFPTEPIAPGVVSMGGAGLARAGDAEAALNPATLTGARHLSLHRFDGYAGYNGFVLAGALRLIEPLP